MSVSVLCCRTSRQAVDEQKKIEAQLVIEVDTARSRMSQIQQELEVVVEQLGEAKVCRHFHFQFHSGSCLCYPWVVFIKLSSYRQSKMSCEI